MAIAIAVSAAPLAAQADVVNGGFETGDFTGWTQGGDTTNDEVTACCGVPLTGSFGAAFGPFESTSSLSQTLATDPGGAYSISFDLRNYIGGAPSSFEVLFGGVSLFSLSDPANFGYTHYTFNSTAAGALTDLTFLMRHDPGYWFLDNVSVTAREGGAVPEPATWAMLIMGFGLVGAAMRRRRLGLIPA